MTAPARTAGDRTDATGGPRSAAAGRRWRRAAGGAGFAVLAMLPFTAFLAVFAAYPMAQVLRMSLSDVQVVQGRFVWSFSGLANFGSILDDPVAWDSVVNTVVFTVATVALTVVLGTALAVLTDRAVLLAGLARNVMLWPAVVAPVVVSLMWLLILSPSIGALNKALATVGLGQQGWLGEPLAAMVAVILVDVWHWTPVVFLLVYVAMKTLDGQVLEAARVDGASEAQVFMRVTLPLLRPALAAAALIRVVMGVRAFDEMFLLTRGGPGTATTLVSLHIRNVFFDRLELGYGAAFGVVVILGTGLVLAVLSALRRVRRRLAAVA